MNDLIESGKVVVSPVGATFSPGIPYEDMEGFFYYMANIRRLSIAALGDALNYSEVEYGQTYAQLAEVTGLESGYLANLKYVFGKVPQCNRIEGMGVSKLQVVAPLPVEMQRPWLEKAQDMGWTRDELRRKINGEGETPKQMVFSLRGVVLDMLSDWRKGENLDQWMEMLEEMSHNWS